MITNENTELYVLIFSSVIIFTCLAGFVVYFIVLYKNKQLVNQQEQEKLKAEFRQEVMKAQLEMQEQTLNNVSREIHDNITQVLSFVKLNLGTIAKADNDSRQLKINESRELIAQTIHDLRDLSKSMSFEHISLLGLFKTINMEAERINKSGIINVDTYCLGEIYPLGEQKELVLFRIFQEALNNTLKHANAANFKISLQYMPQMFNLTIEDDGKGFLIDQLSEKSGSGLRNIESRAKLIGAKASINSLPAKGCCIQVTLPV